MSERERSLLQQIGRTTRAMFRPMAWLPDSSVALAGAAGAERRG